VVGAGAEGMAFTDALIDHADVSVVMVDRRHGVGGHWLDACPFVRLHQASAFYSVASTLLGGGCIQRTGPEAGLHERATAPEVCAQYAACSASECLSREKCRSTRTATTSARAGSCHAYPGSVTRFTAGGAVLTHATCPLRYTRRLGADAGAGQSGLSFVSHPDIEAWADRVSLNAARIPPDMAGFAELTPAVGAIPHARRGGDGPDGRTRYPDLCSIDLPGAGNPTG
jgi:hypothetical protein